MDFSVYISYSLEDKDIVNSLYSILKQSGINVYTSETASIGNLERLEEKSNQIERFIRDSDAILVLLTRDSISSPNIFFEIGVATALKKPTILVAESRIQIPQNISNLPYIVLDRNNPRSTLEQIQQLSLKLKSEKEKGNPIVGVLFLLAALGILLYLSSDQG